MSPQLQAEISPQLHTESLQSQPNIPRWNLGLRIAFRFWLIYLGLYCLATQIIANPFVDFGRSDLATRWPLRPVIFWTAAHIFHVNAPLSVFFEGNSGTSDDMFGWVMTFCLLVMATAATVVWSVLDRRRENYAELHQWFRLFVRLALAATMIGYGFVKVIPTQMSYPSLIRLLQPFGTYSPMGVLWTSMGAAPVYEIFTGCVQVAAGLLLIVPSTVIFGALISLVSMVLVFVLNMTYDTPVKLFAFHLILLACFLLAPKVPRLLALSAEAQLFRTVRANRIALAAQILLALWLVGLYGLHSLSAWSTRGGGRQLPALYGIWEVRQMSIDGQRRPPLLTDSARWRRAIFDYPDRMAFQRLDDSFVAYDAFVNSQKRTVALTKSDDKNSTANFSFQRPARDRLILDGRMDNHQVHMELQLTDRNSFLLVSRGFHWTQETLGGKYDATGK